jgi:2-polyprenyl-6-methoxyphenol hydroxylase-like FAD-dependent oxidoreductase
VVSVRAYLHRGCGACHVPVGGVGINLAVQDAAAAANILAEPLRRGAVTIDTLKQVQDGREFPARVTSVCRSLCRIR